MVSQHIKTVRVYTQAIEFIEQSHIVKSIFADMEEVWLSLYTKEKTCPIVDDVGTNVKRLLIRRYTVALVKAVRLTVGFDLVGKTIDPDISYWYVDDIVQRIADNKTEHHKGLFTTLMSSIFGLSIIQLDFMLNENKTKGELFTLLNKYYDLTILDKEWDEPVTGELLEQDMFSWLKDQTRPMFHIAGY